MELTIKAIANIQTGAFATPERNADAVYLQSKHFDEHGNIIVELFPDLKINEKIERHLLKPGDVIFAAKGVKNFAAVYESHNPKAVASTSFFVIRPTDNKVLPHFLAWFLNNHTTQALLKDQAIGTSIPSISKQVLESLEIPVPDIETQKAIVQISQLRNKEKSLKQRIETLRERQIQAKLLRAISQ